MTAKLLLLRGYGYDHAAALINNSATQLQQPRNRPRVPAYANNAQRVRPHSRQQLYATLHDKICLGQQEQAGAVST
jgi:hypothetical protein